MATDTASRRRGAPVQALCIGAADLSPVAIVFENLEDGMSIDEVMEQFPVTRDQVRAVLEFAARSLDVPA